MRTAKPTPRLPAKVRQSPHVAVDPYLIPGTDILQNKAGIVDAAELSAFEREATAVRSFEAMKNPIPGDFDFDHLKAIHEHLFQDVYAWAGQTRTITMSKGSSEFRVEYIDSFAKQIFSQLKTDNHLKGLDRITFVQKSAELLGNINAMHPFREGNGRAQRAFMDQVAQNAGRAFQWSKISAEEMIAASIESLNWSDAKLEAVIAKALIEALQDQDRLARLELLAKSAPEAYAAIISARENILKLSGGNIESVHSRTALADAMTDRLLGYHESGADLRQLVRQTAPRQPQNRNPDRDR